MKGSPGLLALITSDYHLQVFRKIFLQHFFNNGLNAITSFN